MESLQTKFSEIADRALANHIAELNTRYDARNSIDPDLLKQAYKNHSLILEKELDSEIDQLITDENIEQRASLLELKQAFLYKLKDAESTTLRDYPKK